MYNSFTADDVKKSFDLLMTLDTHFSSLEMLPYNRAEHQDFGSDYLGAKVRNGDFLNCRFIRTHFTGANAQNSRFIDCSFVDCELSSCNLQYCDFNGSVFLSNHAIDEICGTNLSYSDFSHAQFEGLQFEGVSLTKALFSRTKFANLTLIRSTIEASVFKNANITNCDFSKSNIRYCEFEDATIKNTCYPLLDIPFNFGLIELLMREEGNTITARSRNGVLYSSSDILNILIDLLPYYSETEQYFALCNLHLIDQNTHAAEIAFRKAIEATVDAADYYGLQNLCKLAIFSKLFKKVQLRSFYDYVFRVMRPKSENYSEIKRYLSSRNEVREQLVENPENNPVAILSFTTDILENDYHSVCELMKAIECDIKSIDSESIVSFELSHHSPFDFIASIVASMPMILPVCQLIYYSIATLKNSVDLLSRTSRSKRKEASIPEGLEIRYTKKSKCLSFGKFEIVLTSEREKHYGRIKDVTYTITGVDSEITNGRAFLSSASISQE